MPCFCFYFDTNFARFRIVVFVVFSLANFFLLWVPGLKGFFGRDGYKSCSKLTKNVTHADCVRNFA